LPALYSRAGFFYQKDDTMPLDEIARRYAENLYLNQAAKLAKEYQTAAQAVRADFGARNMLASGPFIGAVANENANYAHRLIESRAVSLRQAYEKSGIRLDDAAVEEISNEITTFAQQTAAGMANGLAQTIRQSFPNPPAGLADTMLPRFRAQAQSNVPELLRDLRIRRDEILIEERRALKTYAAAAGKDWDVFISHASEDKQDFVRPLAQALTDSHLKVWYDENTLKVGDSLRQKIDEGLAKSRYGIVILSHHFFAKQWPQQELDGLFAREIAPGVKVILPVWHNISADEVRQYSPLLAGRLAANSTEGIPAVVAKLRDAMGL